MNVARLDKILKRLFTGMYPMENQVPTSTAPASPTVPAVPTVPQPATPPAPPTANPTAASPTPPAKKSSGLMIFTVLLVLIILGVAGWFLYKNYMGSGSMYQKNTNYQTTPTEVPVPTVDSVKSGDVKLDQKTEDIDSEFKKLDSDVKNVDSGLNDKSVDLN